MALIKRDVGSALPYGFSEALAAATLERSERDLPEVAGATAFIRVSYCIASSSSSERLKSCLRVLGLKQRFAGRVFSAESVRRGKPAPDIFLYAAERFGVPPRTAWWSRTARRVSRRALAAGMSVIGLNAASHIRDGPAARLQAADPVHLAASWAEVWNIAIAFGVALHPSEQPAESRFSGARPMSA